MKILALDTSTSRVTVAFLDGEKTISEKTGGELTGAQFHGELLIDLVSEVLQGQRPDLVAVGIGPGPYTGLRVGVTTAEVLATAWQIGVVGVPTLAALAHGHVRRGGTSGTAVLDVKRKEIACQNFDQSGKLIGKPELIHVNDFLAKDFLNVVGPAFVTQTIINPKVSDASPVDAKDIALIGQSLSPIPFTPLYLRQPDAAEPKRPKLVTND